MTLREMLERYVEELEERVELHEHKKTYAFDYMEARDEKAMADAVHSVVTRLKFILRESK